jgi:hypothetical protein
MIIAGVFLFRSLGEPILAEFVIVYLLDMWNHLNFVALPVASMMTSKSILSSQIVAWLSLVMGRPFVIWCSLCVSNTQQGQVNQTLSSHPTAHFLSTSERRERSCYVIARSQDKFWKWFFRQLVFFLPRWPYSLVPYTRTICEHAALALIQAISSCTFLKMAGNANAVFLSLFALASLSWREREVDIFTMRQILRRKWCHRLYNLSS